MNRYSFFYTIFYIYMKFIVLSLICMSILACNAQPSEKSKLETQNEKVAYTIGMNIGKSLKRDSLQTLDLNTLLQGMKHAMSGTDSLMIEKEMNDVMMAFQQEMNNKTEAATKSKGETNLKSGIKFLEDNKNKEGVKITPSGLQYKIVKEGTGAIPTASSTVTVHYKGTLINGTTFDSSIDRGEPASFQVNQVIPGWTEALQMMKKGSKWMLYIPSGLAYGDQAAGPTISPNSTLIFEVELLEIK